jgi:hypothetical protein
MRQDSSGFGCVRESVSWFFECSFDENKVDYQGVMSPDWIFGFDSPGSLVFRASSQQGVPREPVLAP